jgi:hypothetical protein
MIFQERGREGEEMVFVGKAIKEIEVSSEVSYTIEKLV